MALISLNRMKLEPKAQSEAGADADGLDAEHLHAEPLDVEEAGGQGAPGAAHAVYGHGAHRVVHADLVEEHAPTR